MLSQAWWKGVCVVGYVLSTKKINEYAFVKVFYIKGLKYRLFFFLPLILLLPSLNSNLESVIPGIAGNRSVRRGLFVWNPPV